MSTECLSTDGAPSRRSHRSRSAATRVALLINLGTPDAPEPRAVRRYLAEFLSDPEVIRLPGLWSHFNGALARFIALMRAGRSAHAYRKIWTDRGSPLRTITEDQVATLECRLPQEWRVRYAMRYGWPSIKSTLDQIEAEGADELVILPMYPQFAGPTSRTALKLVYEWLAERVPRMRVCVHDCWHDDAGYIEAQAGLIHESARAHNLNPDNCFLLFSAHSMPRTYIERGDPYQQHLLRSVRLVSERLGWPEDRRAVSYQSKMGPVPWLEPHTDEMLDRLAEQNQRVGGTGVSPVRQVLVCPISFTADCLETLEEIGMRYRDRFVSRGGTLRLCPALNTHPMFIKALYHLVRRGPRPVDETRRTSEPLFRTRPCRVGRGLGIDSLVMIGVATPARLHLDGEDKHVNVDREELRRLKRPHHELRDALRGARRRAGLRECWLWNTCSRVELYGWMGADAASRDDQERAMRGAADRLFASKPPADRVTLLRGRAAWRRLLRTAAGLESSLPGETNILEQLRSAHRLAVGAGTVGEASERLIDSAVTIVSELREQTAWGRHGRDYCETALRGVFGCDAESVRQSRCVVVGGSHTALSVLRSLIGGFAVPPDHMTFVHRKSRRGRLMKLLHSALGEGECLPVDSYDDPAVPAVLAGADLVFFTVDRRAPILSASALLARRDPTTKPMTIVDFNQFGSCAGLNSTPGVTIIAADRLDAEVEGFADNYCRDASFLQAAEDADHWLKERTEESIARVCEPTVVESRAPVPAPATESADPVDSEQTTTASAACKITGSEHPVLIDEASP